VPRHGLRRLLGVCVVAAALVCSGVSVAVAKEVPNSANLTQLKTEILAATKLDQLPSSTTPTLTSSMSSEYFSLPVLAHVCTPALASARGPICSFGDTHAKTTVVLYGNSWAQQWAPALDALGRVDHFRLVPFVKPACGTFFETGYVDPFGHVSTLCWRFVQWAVHEINLLHPATIVIASSLGNLLKPGANRNARGANGQLPPSLMVGPTTVQASLAFSKLVSALAPSRARIVLLGNIPIPHSGKYLGTTPNECLLTHQHRILACSVPTPSSLTSTNRVKLMAAAQKAKVPFIDVNSLFCANGTCPLIVHRTLTHYNAIHISAPYALYVSNALGQLLGSALPKK
jgi:hypothetical protein